MFFICSHNFVYTLHTNSFVMRFKPNKYLVCVKMHLTLQFAFKSRLVKNLWNKKSKKANHVELHLEKFL